MSLFLESLTPAMVSAIAINQRYRGSSNGWNSAVGTVKEIERNGHGHVMRVSMLREGGIAPAWFFPSDLRLAS